MRIVGGRFGGRVINPPRNLRARPTTDFAKENLFNVLGNLIDLEGTEVLDLFSGTGSISYEFISRGAAGVTSVEVNAVHHNFIRRTAAAFGMKSASKRFDVIFSDAPYDLEGSEQVVELVFERKLLRPGGLLIFEHSKERSFEGHPALLQVRTYGSVHFSVFRMPDVE